MTANKKKGPFSPIDQYADYLGALERTRVPGPGLVSPRQALYRFPAGAGQSRRGRRRRRTVARADPGLLLLRSAAGAPSHVGRTRQRRDQEVSERPAEAVRGEEEGERLGRRPILDLAGNLRERHQAEDDLSGMQLDG